ncbi:hypothetical protein OJ998_35775 [Solirubrobacter taibaiensis]|nr:hypothetical protein [Solirubrobacter taibaiensis]
MTRAAVLITVAVALLWVYAISLPRELGYIPGLLHVTTPGQLQALGAQQAAEDRYEAAHFERARRGETSPTAPERAARTEAQRLGPAAARARLEIKTATARANQAQDDDIARVGRNRTLLDGASVLVALVFAFWVLTALRRRPSLRPRRAP